MMDAIQIALIDPSVVNATAFTVSALVGQSLHFVKKWADGEDWVMANLRRTIGAFVGNIAGIIGFIATGALDDMTKIGTVIALGAFMGFSADSALNKGSREQWDQAKRDANKPAGP